MAERGQHARCGGDNGIALHSYAEGEAPPPRLFPGCRHGQAHWRHVHWRLDDQPMCRIECRCGRVMAKDGCVGHAFEEVASWGWREGTFA